MNFELLWMDALIVSLLWVAALAACVGRVKRGWMPATLSPVVVGVPLFPLGTFVFAASTAKFISKVEPNWFGYALSLLLAYLIGASLILRRASRRHPGLPPAAAAWRRGPLALAWLLAGAVGYMTLLNMDLVIRARGALLSVQMQSVYLATLPAITSDAQNAAPMYERAFAILREDPPAGVDNPPFGKSDNFDPNEPATIAFLNRQATTITLLRRAAALPRCRFDQDLLDPDVALMLPTLNAEHNAANVLRLHAREEIAHGHASSAIDDAGAILRMSRQFGERPTVIAALVAIDIDAMGNKTLEEALGLVKSQNELSGLRLEELSSFGRMFQQALRGEERFGLAQFGNMPPERTEKGSVMEAQHINIASAKAGIDGAFVRVFFVDSDVYLKLMENLQDLSVHPYYKIRRQLADIPGKTWGRGMLTSLVIPALAHALESCANAEASDACAQAAVAMTRFKIDRGSLPPHLGDLVPAYLDSVPIDPFDGQPLRLVIKGDQWIIYSVGPDCKDDGGVAITHGKGDVIFTLRNTGTQATTKP